MRPFHEVMRVTGLEEGAGVNEPIRIDPMALAHLGITLHRLGRSFAEVDQGLEVFCREENVKPSVLMAAVREVRVSAVGQPGIRTSRLRLISGHTKDLKAIMEGSRRRHPSNHGKS